MTTYSFDPTGTVLQNKVVGEVVAFSAESQYTHQVIMARSGPYFADSLLVKYTDAFAVSRILMVDVDYRPAYYFADASGKCNREIFGGIELFDKTLEGNLTFVYQSLGGSYQLTEAFAFDVENSPAPDPQFTTLESLMDQYVFPYNPFPVVDHPWQVANLSTIQQAIRELEKLGLVVHLRPRFLPTPQSMEFIPTAQELGLGQVANYPPATEALAREGVSTTSYLTPATGRACAEQVISDQLTLMGYRVPTAYAPTLSVTDTMQTYSYQDDVYRPRPSAIPFTTSGIFETEKFIKVTANAPKHWQLIRLTVTGGESTDALGNVILDLPWAPTSAVETRVIVNEFSQVVEGVGYRLSNGQLFLGHPVAAGDVLRLYLKEQSMLASPPPFYSSIKIESGTITYTVPGLSDVEVSDLFFTLNGIVLLDAGNGEYEINGNDLTIHFPTSVGDEIEIESIDTVPDVGRQYMLDMLYDQN